MPSGEKFEKIRYVVQMRQITYPNGEKHTRSFIPFDIEGRGHTPNSDIINVILPRIDDEYRLLIEKCQSEGLVESLDQFFKKVSDFAVVGEGLKETLVVDTNTNITVIEKSLMETQWFKSTIEFLQRESRKGNKTDPIKYAESVRQVTDTFDSGKAMHILNKNGVKLKKSAIGALRRIANETPKIKMLIKEGKLKLTIAFELPDIDENDREKAAQQIASLEGYAKQKQLLRKMRISA